MNNNFVSQNHFVVKKWFFLSFICFRRCRHGCVCLFKTKTKRKIKQNKQRKLHESRTREKTGNKCSFIRAYTKCTEERSRSHTHAYKSFLKWILLGESEHKLIGLYHLIESDEKGKIFISIRTEHFCCGCGGLKTENTYTETVQRWKFLFHRIHIQLNSIFVFCFALLFSVVSSMRFCHCVLSKCCDRCWYIYVLLDTFTFPLISLFFVFVSSHSVSHAHTQ